MNILKLRLSLLHSPRWRRLFSGEHRFPDTHLQTFTHASPNTKPNSFSAHQNPKPQTPSINDIFDESSVLESLSSYNNDYKRALEFFNWLQTDNTYKGKNLKDMLITDEAYR